jgi:hypothetical protein
MVVIEASWATLRGTWGWTLDVLEHLYGVTEQA